MSRILVVDDKEMMRDSVAGTLVRKGHTVVAVGTASAALEKLTQRGFDAVITDLQMPEMDGLDLLAEIRRIDEQMSVVLMTAYGTVETAVRAMKDGAYDYITKPFSGDELLVAVERAIQHAALLKENQILKATRHNTPETSGGRTHEMIGSGPTMQQLRGQVMRIADSHGTVLVSGESGAGKEVAARWIHENSPRRDAPFLALNCAALSTNLLESELFGHEKGAFTGADKLRKGRFELADGGTLLLDEISEIAPEIQAKLLRVLQEHTFERVGSSTSRQVDVRVIATTNRDLPAEVSRGTFRQDLYFRLNVLPLALPALRAHPEDIPELARHFFGQVSAREGRATRHFSEESLQLLCRYGWPGNVRELQNICERAAVLAPGEEIVSSMIAPWLNFNGAMRNDLVQLSKPASMIELQPGPDDPLAASGAVHGDSGANLASRIICDGSTTLDDVERDVIVATLKFNNGHRQKSAKALGIGVRTLGLKLKKWKGEALVPESL